MEENPKRIIDKIIEGITFSRIVSILSFIIMGMCIYIFSDTLKSEFTNSVSNTRYFIGFIIIAATLLIAFKLIVSSLSPETTKIIFESITFSRVIYFVAVMFVVAFIYFFKDSLGDSSRKGEYLIIRFLITLGLVATTAIIGVKLVFNFI